MNDIMIEKKIIYKYFKNGKYLLNLKKITEKWGTVYEFVI